MIFIFKTSVTDKDIAILQELLHKHLENAKWNFDLEDCDNILRIESVNDLAGRAIKLLQDHGFECQELED